MKCNGVRVPLIGHSTSSKRRIKFPLISAVLLYLLASSSARAQFLSVHGGPTYNQATLTGYQNSVLSVTPGSTAGNGLAVGYAEKFTGGTSLGRRPVRWDAASTAATELGDLGTNGNGNTLERSQRNQYRRRRRRLRGEVHRRRLLRATCRSLGCLRHCGHRTRQPRH